MHNVQILTADPTIIPLAEMQLSTIGVENMLEWVRDHRPECVPEEMVQEEGSPPPPPLWLTLFPHNGTDEDTGRELTANELLVELAGRKCIAEGTLVETTDGPKRIESVAIGDYVVVPEGEFKVTAVSANGVKDIVIVETRDGYAVPCTADHLVHTTGGWVEAGALSTGDTVTLASGVTTWGGYGTFEEGYVCGLFLGDGTFAGDGFKVANIRLFGDKMQLMRYVEDATNAKSISHRDGTALSLNSKAWGQKLCEVGVQHGMRAVTQAIELASSAFQRGVLCGLWDTDGSLEVSGKTRRAKYSSSNRESLAAVQRMLLRLGIFSRMALDRAAQEELVICGVKTKGKAAYKLTIAGAAFVRFTERIGSRRRYTELETAARREQRKSPTVTFGEVLAVRAAGSARVYDLSVEEGSPHSFVANGIVVHNCYDSFGLKAGRKSNKAYIENTQGGDIPHASIMYHAKMSFFFAGISRRVSHEIIRNYVGADRDEEGSPSQESTRFTHHYGFFIAPPKYLSKHELDEDLLHKNTMLGYFERSMQTAYDSYLGAVALECAEWRKEHGKLPTSIDKKRIYEAASSFLPHQAETSFVWTTNPSAIAKFIKERANNAADLEIQRFARAWRRVCVARWPNLFPQPHMTTKE